MLPWAFLIKCFTAYWRHQYDSNPGGRRRRCKPKNSAEGDQGEWYNPFIETRKCLNHARIWTLPICAKLEKISPSLNFTRTSRSTYQHSLWSSSFAGYSFWLLSFAICNEIFEKCFIVLLLVTYAVSSFVLCTIIQKLLVRFEYVQKCADSKSLIRLPTKGLHSKSLKLASLVLAELVLKNQNSVQSYKILSI